MEINPCGGAIWVGDTLLTSGYNIIVSDIRTPWPVAYTKLTFNFTFTGVLTSGNIAISCAETGGIFQTMGSINAGDSSFTYELPISSPNINNDFSFVISYDNPDVIEWSLNTIYAAE